MAQFSVITGGSELSDYTQTGGVRTPTGTTEGARTYPLLLLWTSRYEDSSYSLPTEKVFAATQGKQPVVVARTGWGQQDQYLAIKGGQADLGHGHMDAGSFCYEAYGYRWVTDFIQDDYDIIEKAVADLDCGDLWSYADGSVRWKVICRRICKVEGLPLESKAA